MDRKIADKLIKPTDWLESTLLSLSEKRVCAWERERERERECKSKIVKLKRVDAILTKKSLSKKHLQKVSECGQHHWVCCASVVLDWAEGKTKTKTDLIDNSWKPFKKIIKENKFSNSFLLHNVWVEI